MRITEPAFSEAKDFQSDACQAIQYERSIFASGFFRAAQSLPQPSSVPVCFGLNASLEETQELLKQCGFAQLYPKDRRDAIILYGILNGMDLFGVNDKLFAENEETLY